MYKLTQYQNVIRTADGACIPFDPDNTDYQAFLLWCSEGNTPLEANMPTPADESA
jgi:hypothetical protein